MVDAWGALAVRLAVVITARPSYARIQTALEALRPQCDLHVIAAGAACLPRYGAIVQTIRADGFHGADLPGIWEDDHPEAMVQTTAAIASSVGRELRRVHPDVVVTIADRFETLGTALAATYQGFPLIHIQGGERTGSIDDKVRHAITQLADLHLVASREAAFRVMASGGPTFAQGVQVIVTGCPSVDLATRALKTALEPKDFWARNGGVGPPVSLSEPFLMVLYHPDTRDWQTAGSDMAEVLRALDRPALVWWPNLDAGSDAIAKTLRQWREHDTGPPVHVFRHVPAEDFYRLLARTEMLIGNSSVGIREAAWIGTKVVNVGRRQERRERAGNVQDCPPTVQDIQAAMVWWRNHPPPPRSTCYGDGSAGTKIARAILGWKQKTPPVSVEETTTTSRPPKLQIVTGTSVTPSPVTDADFNGVSPI